VTLQRPPPEIRTFVRNSDPRSKMEISFSGLARAQAIAAKNPAAPPPMIAICTRHRDADARSCNAAVAAVSDGRTTLLQGAVVSRPPSLRGRFGKRPLAGNGLGGQRPPRQVKQPRSKRRILTGGTAGNSLCS